MNLPEALHGAVASFIGLDYLRLRACSREFRALLAKNRTIAILLREEQLKTFFRDYGRPKNKCDALQAFRNVRDYGHLAVAQWLTIHYRLTPKDARDYRNYELRRAWTKGSTRGSLIIAIWLVSYFSLTVADARSWDNYALRHACEKGHLTTAVWLVGHFGLTIEDAKYCSSKDAATVAWLADFRAGTWHKCAFLK